MGLGQAIVGHFSTDQLVTIVYVASTAVDELQRNVTKAQMGHGWAKSLENND